MSRPKKADPLELIGIVEEYYETEAYGDSRKLKATRLAAFAQRKGYDLKEYDFRRSDEVNACIRKLKEAEIKEFDAAALAYKTLDVDGLLRECISIGDLKDALVKMDGYWKTVYSAAQKNKEKYQKAESELERLKGEYEKIRIENGRISESESNLKSDNTRLRRENEYLRSVIRENIYPACVNEILKDENIQFVESNTIVLPERIREFVEGETPQRFNRGRTEQHADISTPDNIIRVLRSQIDNVK